MYNLCCISNELKDQGYKFQTMTWKRTVRRTQLDQLGKRWLNNVEVTRLCMNTVQRMVGDTVYQAHCSHLLIQSLSTAYRTYLSTSRSWRNFVTLFITTSRGRFALSTHPDQFNVLASENQASVDKTIAELNHHGWVMDMLVASVVTATP